MSKKNIIILSVVGVLALGGAFYGGVAFEKTKTPRRTLASNFPAGQRPAGGNANFARGGMGGGGFVSGEIISKDDKSVTVKMPGGSTKIIFYSGTTTVGKATAGSADDLTVGAQVTATGPTNSDGSVTAQNIQIRPDNMMRAPQN
jgi:hypothetical protein